MKRHVKIITLFAALFFFYALIHCAFSIYREIKGDSIDLSILDPTANYVITFNPNQGTLDNPNDATRTKTYNQAVGTLPTASRTGYNFIGWYTDPDPDEGTKVHPNTLVTGTTTYYAHWVKIVCKKAQACTLHTETCASNGSCTSHGYSANSTITYGTIPGNNSPITGDAYDCDVNDDGTYDAGTERFYYIRGVVDTSGSEPVESGYLVHFTSFDAQGQMDSSKTRGSYVYDEALTHLPNATTWGWDNPNLISMNGNVTRFITREDLAEACGDEEGGSSFTTCQFFLENSRFQSKDLGRAGIWLEKENNTLYRIHTETLVAHEAPSATSENTARPVIGVYSNAIEGYSEKEMYTVTFDSQGGTPSTFEYYKYDGQKVGTLPTEPTKTDFTFDGWYTDNINYTTEVTENTVVTSTTTYYAKWLPNITVNFNANAVGATVSPSSKTVAQGKAIGTMPIPTYEHHEFLGWFTDPTDGTEVLPSTIINAGMTLYAHWESEAETLQYVFHIPGECSFTSSGLANGAGGNCISTVNPTGQTIDYTESTLSAKKYIDTGVALYNTTNHGRDYEIGFTIVSYSTTGQADKATLMNTKAEVSTSTMKYPGVVFRRNNSTDDFLLQSRKTLSANEEYTVASSTVQNVKIYRINDEIYYSINDAPKVLLNTLEAFNPVFDLNVWFGAAPTNAAATSAQRYFTGTLSDMYIKIMPDAADLATVTFDPNYQGAQTFDKDVIKGNAVGELTTPERPGYTFAGWFTDPTNGTQISTSTIINDDITYYAHWVENVTITLIPGTGATVTPNTVTLASGSEVGDLLPTPEKTGSTFLGWYEESTWETPVTSSTTVSSNVSFYAKWVENVTASFIPGEGATVTPNSITVAPGSALGELPTPEKTGYTFKGWFTDPTSGTQITSSTTINADTSYYAHWVKNVTVTFNADGGTASFNSKELEPGTAVGELPTATKTNAIFDGWYDENDTSYTNPITTSTIVNTDVTYKAKWIATNYVAEVNGTYYETLAAAIGAVPTTGVKTTVTLLQDVTATETMTIPNNKWVELDIGTYTISTNTGTFSLFTNKGKLDIINGNLYSSAGYIIENFTGSTLNISGGTLTYNNSNQTEYKVAEIKGGTVNITGGSLSCNSKAAVINVKGGTLNVSGGEIKGSNTFKGQAIYNDGGTTNISGTAYLENNSQTGSQNGRSCVTNNAGTVNITGGTIISKNNAGVKNNGTMTIGTDEGTIDIISPVIQGKTYGLETVSGKPVTIYDGIFKGGDGNNPAKAISNEAYTSHGTATIVHDTETISGVTYDVAYLNDTSVSITVTFNPNGGTVSPVSKTFTSGNAIGELPTPTYAGYTFLGWYLDNTWATEVTASTTFDATTSIIAKWAENITVTFNATANGGSINAGDPNTKTYTEVGTVGEMPSASKTSAAFLGWFTASTGGERVLTTTVVDDDVTYYAHYTSQTTVCKPATTLHSSGNTDFGQIPSGDSLSAGDAFDCDVNGDGTYDATNERFYYLTDTSNGNAVFIFANNTSQVGGNASAVCSATAIAYGSDGPTTAIGELPTTNQWTNVNIYTEPRDITNGTATMASDFTYTQKAARFATLDEIKAATSSSINGTTNELASYTFLLENTPSYTSGCRSNYWLETPASATNVYRIDGAAANKKLGNVAIATSNSGVRPVIEVPYSSIDGIMNIVEFDTIPTAMRTYFDNISTWDAGQSDSNHSSFDTAMTNNLNTNKCVYFENDNRDTEVNTSGGFTNYCDQPKQYDTGVTGNINVYEYNESTGAVSNSQASYVTNNNGKLYNFIPGKVYYWESATDSSKNGYVKPLGERRIISIDNTAPNSTKYKMRNVRDLGGIKVDTNADGTIDGTIKYGKLFRSEKIWCGDGTTVQYLNKLGIYNEMDLRADSEVATSTEDSLHKITSNPSNSSNKVFEIIHYGIDYTNNYANYKLSRDAATRVMYEFVKAHNDGDDNYALLFHCRIGADRTGTLAYILEGLLGAPTEERYRDYELTVFFGLRERTRYYFNKGSNEVKFQYLKKAIRDAGDGVNEDVITWFLKDGNTATVTDEDTLQTVNVNLPTLISDFRSIMIDSY